MLCISPSKLQILSQRLNPRLSCTNSFVMVANKLSNECVQMLVNGVSNIETLHRFIHSCYPYQFTTCSVKPCMILYDIQQWKPKDSRISLEHLESRSLMLSSLFAIQQSFYAMIIRTNEVFSIRRDS